MGCRILTNCVFSSSDFAVMYCSTTEWAFGPVFCSDDKGHSAEERLQLFMDWLPQDPRRYADNELEQKYGEWLRQEDEQWKQKEDEELQKEEEERMRWADEQLGKLPDDSEKH